MQARATVGVLAVGALLLGACGTDDDEAGAGTTNAPIEVPDDAVPFDPALPPVVVGFHNTEGGSYSLPEAREAFESGVEYVNNELGGINGHELQVEYCNVDTTPESSVDCANQFVDQGVVASVMGYDFGVDASLPVLREAGILEIASIPSGATDASVGDVIMLGPSAQGGGFAGGLVRAANNEAESIAWVLADIPAMHGFYEPIPGLAEQLGLETEVFYYQQPVDWTTFAPTVLSSNPDEVNMFGVDADFLAAIPAFRGAGFENVFNANTFAAYDDLDADLREDVVVLNAFYTETMGDGVPDEAQADLAVWERYRAGLDDVGQESVARTGFYMAVMTADVLRQVDDPTSAAAVRSQGVSSSGHVFFSDQEYDCSRPTWPGTTSCTGINIYASIAEDGSLEVLPDQPVDVSEIVPSG